MELVPSLALNARLHGPVPQLEEPSKTSQKRKASLETQKVRAAEWEKPKLPKLKVASLMVGMVEPLLDVFFLEKELPKNIEKG